MSLVKHGELYFILASTCFSPLAILASVWKKWFPTATDVGLTPAQGEVYNIMW